VDIVVPTIGRASLLRLLTALGAGQPAPRAIVLVDDRRDTSTPLLTLPLRPELAARTIVVPGGARGPAAARNRGFAATEADWVVFVDDDVVPSHSWLGDLQADLAALPPHAAASQGRLHVPLPSNRRATDWERNVQRLERAAWITADLAVRRDAFEEIGGFDARFPRAYREDTDLALRLTKAGWSLVRGQRLALHPAQPAPWWISVRAQRGNMDDALMAALHGHDWVRANRGRRPRHLLLTALGATAAGAAVAGAPRLAAASAAAWTVGTAEFAWSRIAPGPRDRREVATMLATSAIIPAAATWYSAIGVPRARWLCRRSSAGAC